VSSSGSKPASVIIFLRIPNLFLRDSLSVVHFMSDRTFWIWHFVLMYLLATLRFDVFGLSLEFICSWVCLRRLLSSWMCLFALLFAPGSHS
jgi:hypothetical protein